MNRVFIGIATFILYAASGAWATDTSVLPHQFNKEDQQIIDVLANKSGKQVEDVIRLYQTGKGWGDVAENLGLEMEDVIKEVARIRCEDAAEKKGPR